MAIADYITASANPNIVNPLQGRDNAALVTGTLESMIGGNSDLIKNARQRGVEYANQRGGINSTIAAGAAERSAMETGMPLVNASLEMQAQQDAANLADWSSQQNFARGLYGQQISNSLGMLNTVQQYALEDPELYTPEVTSGYANFFQKNMNDIMNNYFKGINGG